MVRARSRSRSKKTLTGVARTSKTAVGRAIARVIDNAMTGKALTTIVSAIVATEAIAITVVTDAAVSLRVTKLPTPTKPLKRKLTLRPKTPVETISLNGHGGAAVDAVANGIARPLRLKQQSPLRIPRR